MNGVAPLSVSTIDAWSRLTETDVQPHEVNALLVLDSVKLHPQSPGE
jgi:hypothetical protein